jgi:hypothetical protein
MKKLEEKQIWQIIMTVIPVVMLANLGKELTSDSGMRIMYSGLFGGIGGLIGFVTKYLTEDKSRITKILASVGIIMISGTAVYLVTSKKTDEEIIHQKWIPQKIGLINFDTPEKLELQSDKIPESVKDYYDELNIYTDNNDDRITTVMSSKIKVDTMPIEHSFSNALTGMLTKLQFDLNKFEFESIETDGQEISSRFSVEINGEKAYGYGYMFKKDKNLESAWLIPIKRGFSKEYIEEFEAGIISE